MYMHESHQLVYVAFYVFFSVYMISIIEHFSGKNGALR